MKKIKLFFSWHYIKIGIALLLLVISMRPLLFTWNFLWASYHLKKDKYAAGAHMVGALSYKPAVLKIFDKYSPGVIDYYLVKSAVLNNDKKIITAYSHLVPFDGIYTRYKDNFYFRDMLGELDQKGEWRHLDEVSFDMLSTEQMNPRTQAILEKVWGSRPFIDGLKKLTKETKIPEAPEELREASANNSVSAYGRGRRPLVLRTFLGGGCHPLRNLADFALWKGNTSLSRYLTTTYFPGGECFDITGLPGCDYDESATRLKQILAENYKLRAEDLGANEIPCPGFTGPTSIARYWYFSDMSGGRYFSRGSFIMGIDRTGKDQNPVLRLMGFFVSKDPGKSLPRGGARSRKHITAENGFYVAGFDYLTVTGQERPSFHLGKNLEQHLPPTRQQWKKAILIVNNAFNTHEDFNPLVRMWGTGTMLVDNVFLAKVSDLKFSITEPWLLHIATTPIGK